MVKGQRGKHGKSSVIQTRALKINRYCIYTHTLFRTFQTLSSKLRKATISFVVSIHLSFRLEQVEFHSKDIYENRYLMIYLLTYLLTYSTHHRPSWEANRFAASPEIPHTLWNPKAHHRIHKCPPSVPILRQLHPVSTLSHFPKFHFNIILPSTSGSPQYSLSLRFPHQNPVHTSPLPICATFPAHLILLKIFDDLPVIKANEMHYFSNLFW